jgi:dTDP-4-amino-4,6-dideoxygalactose transaminase
LYNSHVTSAVETLEREFAARRGFTGAVAAGFGRAALRLALEASEVREGDVLVPDFVCAQVPEAVRRAGGRPVYFPVSRELQVAPDAFRTALTANTRAAVVVHYFGCPLPAIAMLAEICRERRIPLIEDCALAMGCEEAGAHGSAAVFSFTKSDWCYGGGMFAAREPALIARARMLREESFQPAAALALRYGWLRHADFLANRPQRSRAAEFAGRTLETLCGFHAQGFYDAGRFDSRMTDFAARRARRLEETLRAITDRRREIVQEIRRSLGAADDLLLERGDYPQDSCAFLLMIAAGPAHTWRQLAARHDVTLRLSWPAYQSIEPAQATAAVRWLAAHLLILEIHPELTDGEAQRISRSLQALATSSPREFR